MSFKVPENHRTAFDGPGLPNNPAGNNGAFKFMLGSRLAFAIATDNLGWEHVSVSLPDRCLTWNEMCKVKDLFWGPEDEVIQIHPAKSEYVNFHPFCLHLWRPADGVLILPGSKLYRPGGL